MTVTETMEAPTPVRAVDTSSTQRPALKRPAPTTGREQARGERPWFADPRGLRRLLVAVYRGGRDGWRSHPDVPALLAYCQDKYGALARRNGQSPQDAVTAAFEVLAVPSILDADDPWAVVTTAVQRTLQAQDRAHRLLCSTDQARRLMHSDDHDIARFCDLDPDASIPDMVDRVASANLDGPSSPLSGPAGSATEVGPLDVRVGLITVRTVLTATGWAPEITRVGVDYVCERLRIAGNQATAFEYLRRETTPLQLLGMDQRTWVRLCRILLGEPGRPGLLARAVLGERPVDLLADASLVTALSRPPAEPAGVRHG